MLTVKQALDQGTRLLADAAAGAPRLTAEVLLCHAIGKERTYLYAHPEEDLSEHALIHYARYLDQRLSGAPPQYITGVQEFYGRPFAVTPEVLIPRPETEHVVEAALARACAGKRAADIGCGSGAIGITWRLETGCETVATDISEGAARIARRNAAALHAQVPVVVCDLGSALAPSSFDLVLSNPPYIPETEAPALQKEVRDFEPPIALYGGPTGVEIYQRLLGEAARLLRPGGWLVVEIGYQAQDRILALMAEGWSEAEVAHDLAGWPRVVSSRYTP